MDICMRRESHFSGFTGILLPKGNEIHYIGGTEVLPAPLTAEEEAEKLRELGEQGSETAKACLIEHNLRLVVYIAKKFDNTGVGVEDLISIGTIGLELGEQGSETAKACLIEHNLRLVVYIAKKFDNTGVGVEDLISIGTIGLIKAINTFNPGKKIKLATYASRCIENEILMYLRRNIKAINTFNPGKKIKLATYASRCIENEILMYLRRNSKTKMEVSIDEPLNVDWDGNELLLSDILGTDEDVIYKDIESQVERSLLGKAIGKSIDEPLNVDWDGNELLLSDILGTDEDVIYKDIESQVERSLLGKAIGKLSKREQTIVRLRFGINMPDGREKTQKEVADLLGISQSYISRLEKKIMKRLKKAAVWH